jgi:AhpD family alkylhydroperoxidase
MTMQARLDFRNIAPGAVKTMLGIEAYLAKCGLERRLIHLVKMRASQINGCAYCLDMHSKDARAEGETEQRLYALDAWHETPFYTQRERAALAWTDALTLVAQTHAPDDVYQAARAEFSEQELADLTLAVVAINGWNRISIGFRTEPGTYRPAKCVLPAKAVEH